MSLTGTLQGSNITFISASLAGQVTTVRGSVTDTTFTGTYIITGGCANGDQGSVTGRKIPLIGNILTGTFTTSGGGTFDVAGNIDQANSASPAGSFGITGTVSFSTPCFSSGTFNSGMFPSGSFILGTSVLEIGTGNGTVTFQGTTNPTTGQIKGAYAVTGGTCDQTGTALLVLRASTPWDY